MRYILIGRGKMGRLLQETARPPATRWKRLLAAKIWTSWVGFGKVADVVIDFSPAGGFAGNLLLCPPYRNGAALRHHGLHVGSAPELQALGSAAPVLWSANFSLGVAVLARALRDVTGVLRPEFDIEVTEVHHNQKTDAPSGTAKLLVEAMDPCQELTPVYGRQGQTGRRNREEIGIHALQGAAQWREPTLCISSAPDEELEFTHRAASRQIFVNGAFACGPAVARESKRHL